MEEPRPIEAAGGTPSKSELPMVESPSISPANDESTAEPVIADTSVADRLLSATLASRTAILEQAKKMTTALSTVPRVTLTRRRKRYALLAASMALVGAFGAIVGAAASGGFTTPVPRIDAVAVEERNAMQQTITQLAKEVATLKTGLEAANKSTRTQLAKLTERVDRTASADLVTGSISAPQTAAPLPTPRPAPRIAAADSQPPARPVVVQGWVVREARDGFVYVQGHGDIYQVVPGAPLPGLGPVESIKRQDGRWVVTTPKGIIVSMRDRRYFE